MWLRIPVSKFFEVPKEEKKKKEEASWTQDWTIKLSDRLFLLRCCLFLTMYLSGFRQLHFYSNHQFTCIAAWDRWNCKCWKSLCAYLWPSNLLNMRRLNLNVCDQPAQTAICFIVLFITILYIFICDIFKVQIVTFLPAHLHNPHAFTFGIISYDILGCLQ